MKKLKLKNNWFKDEADRIVILRGVNLSGDSKVPFPGGATHYITKFTDHKHISFINRPFSLEEAGKHFLRLKKWGFNVIRLITTWEAVEHKGPGIYDYEYIDFFVKICKKAEEYGFYVIINFHQDVWSRMTGGDGAPCWTFKEAGIDYSKLSDADAAFLMQFKYDFKSGDKKQHKNYSNMSWQYNLNYFGTCLMYTLFFGGKDFAPQLCIDRKNIQDFFQEHFINCNLEIAKRVKDMSNIIGFNAFNEPGEGWIGKKLKTKKIERFANPGVYFDPLNALYISHGHSAEVPFLDINLFKLKMAEKRKVKVNPDRLSVWLEGNDDYFQKAGVYRIKDGKPIVLKNDYFCIVKGKAVDFESDYLFPFYHKIAGALHKINSDWMIFGEKNPKNVYFDPSFKGSLPKNFVNASHWYDPILLKYRKSVNRLINFDTMNFMPAFGKKGVENMYYNQLKKIVKASENINKGTATFIGEFGIPFDLNDDYAYKNWKTKSSSWNKHIDFLNSMYNSIDRLFLSSAQWNYTPNNSNRWGDLWNQEDFSIFSYDQQADKKDINSGGRALKGFVRPFVHFTQGTPVRIRYNYKKREFLYIYESDSNIKEPTVIFIPNLFFQDDYRLRVKKEHLVRIEKDYKNQLLKIYSDKNEKIKIKVIKN